MNKLSVALITKNEEAVIGRCLESLKWADEIVILDGYSNDKTVEICKKYTDKIYQKTFESFPKERAYILEKTSYNWVLSVDADMCFTEEICVEIQELLKGDIDSYSAYRMRGLTIFVGGKIKHCGWFDPIYLRLFNKQKGSYDVETLTVYDPFLVQGEVGFLKNYFLHYGGDSFIDYFGKIKRYSYLTALEYKNKGVKINFLNWLYYLAIKPELMFVYKYFYKRGFLDGIPGLLVSINSAISYYVAYATLWDIQRKERKG